MFQALQERFRAVLRSWADSVWNRPFLGWLLIAGFGCLYCYWILHIPSPGKASAVLGVIAVVITFRSIGGVEKSIWMIVLFAFLCLEIKAIDTDRALFEQERHETRMEERRSFDEIGKGIKGTVRQLTNILGYEQAIKESTERFPKPVPQLKQRALLNWLLLSLKLWMQRPRFSTEKSFAWMPRVGPDSMNFYSAVLPKGGPFLELARAVRTDQPRGRLIRF